ncbi:predicted protein [Naegleria gruberi]|uniref:Predicted protein n=1 Tax=Naegleria gruberi TaxID=5762 RepID=D2V4Y1_NAEGR|nr:uncharacterized protein NAEGRDRAFT_31083 [Naegleria gruberi]EFC48182.1 predicted protein [Naegleria gruberi]|eukprot:XP_002680926.1 predicted protein [Naegleria gruberi strain NEG-M]
MKLLTYIDSFAVRQFQQGYKGGTQIPISVQSFEEQINKIWSSGDYQLKDGYAPFCKHLFVPNFAGCKQSFLEITKDNEHLLRTEYQQRKESELPVLCRYFPYDLVKDQIKDSKYLDIILYSKEQILKESEAMQEVSDYEKRPEITDCEWGIISVKSQDVDYELPMTPITMMRNALGKEEGGSGVPLERTKYMDSVEFWKNYATIA